MSFLRKWHSLYLMFLFPLMANAYEQPEECCLANEWCSGYFEVTGEWLYWQPYLVGQPYALTFTQISPFGSPIADEISIENVEYDFTSGFRFGGAYVLPCSQWDLSVAWTRHRGEGKASVEAGGGILVATLWDAVPLIEADLAAAKSKSELDYVDITIGKRWEFCGCFYFKPYVGGRYYRIKNKQSIFYDGEAGGEAANSSVQLINTGEGWGVLAGEHARWHLPCGFGLFGKSSVSVMLTDFELIQNQQFVFPTTPSNNFDLISTSHLRSIKGILIAHVGVDWQKKFYWNCCPLYFNLFVGYEIDYFPVHSLLTRAIPLGSATNANAVPSNQGDIGFRGVTAGATFRF